MQTKIIFKKELLVAKPRKAIKGSQKIAIQHAIPSNTQCAKKRPEVLYVQIASLPQKSTKTQTLPPKKILPTTAPNPTKTQPWIEFYVGGLGIQPNQHT